ncbi:hypothetical protein E8E13_000034, partial [Curvularia kusanoi]
MYALARLAAAVACTATVLATGCYYPNGNQSPGTDVDNNGTPVYSCNSTSTDSYCCYDGCDCQANSGFEIFTFAQSPADVYTVTIIGESFVQTHTSAASSATQTSNIVTTETPSAASSTSTSGAAATSTSSSTAKESKGTNTVALGVGLGVGIGVAALLGIGVFFFCRRRKNRKPYAPPSQLSTDEYVLSPHHPSTKYAYTAEAKGSLAPTAITTTPQTHEMGDERSEKLVELPANEPSAQSSA